MKHLVCSNMWNNLTLNIPEQEVTHCCKMTRYPMSKDQLKELDGEFNRIPYFVEQKNKFIKTNELPETCVRCKTSWPNSVWKSWNKWQNKDWSEQELESLLDEDRTRFIEIFLSTTCNIACTYCSEAYSSRWADIKGLRRTENSEWKDLMLENLYKYIKKYHADDVREDRIIYGVLGGEPLLNLEIFDVLKNIMSLYATPDKRVQFNITTNLCVKPRVIQNLLDVIKSKPGFTWIITPSIDAIGKRAEEIRDGLDFELFAKNLKTLADSKLLDSINIQPAVNSMSVKYYSELLEWLTTVFDPNEFGKSWTIRNNLVYNPVSMSVNILPEKYKQYIDECVKVLEAYPNTQDKEELLRHLDVVKNNINTKRDEKTLTLVKGFFTRHGKLKNKNYFEIFPELSDILI